MIVPVAEGTWRVVEDAVPLPLVLFETACCPRPAHLPVLACGARGPAEDAPAAEGGVILGHAAVSTLGPEPTVGSI